MWRPSYFMVWTWGGRPEVAPGALRAQQRLLPAVWSWPTDLVGAVHARGHATAAETIEASVGTAHVFMLLDDADPGRYEGTAPRGQDHGDGQAETMRFWLRIPSEGLHNHHGQQAPNNPVAFDAQVTGFGREVLPESTAAFAHIETDHHARLPGLGGNAAMPAGTGFDAVVQEGRRPHVQLNKTWVH